MAFPKFFAFLLCLFLVGCGGDSNLSALKPSTPPGEQASPGSDNQDSDPQPEDPVAGENPGSGEDDDPVAGEPPSDNDDPVAGGDPADNEDPVADIERPELQWDSPLTREDGSKLFPGEISGYRVYFRLRHENEFSIMELQGPGSNSLELEDFDAGAYEFAVSTLDTNGLESRRSAPVPVDLI